MPFPSTFLALQDRVINGLRLDPNADRAKVKDWLNQVLRAVHLAVEYREKRGTANLTAGVASYLLPSSILRLKLLAVKQAGQDEYGPPLQQMSLDEIMRRRYVAGGASQARGFTSHYALVLPDRLELWPTPATNDTLLVYYVVAPTVMSADGDYPDLPEPYATYLLEYGARVEGAKFLGLDPQLDQRDYELWLGKLRQFLHRLRGGQTMPLTMLGESPFIPHDPSLDLRGITD